jgi:hypothetical protein
MGEDNTQNITTQQDKNIPNPEGKGGFGDHPENRNPGGWKPENSFPYQYKRFMNMGLEEFKEWQKNNPERTVVEDLAFTSVFKAKSEHKYLTEVANRADGMPRQSIDATSDGERIGIDILPMLEKIYGKDK